VHACAASDHETTREAVLATVAVDPMMEKKKNIMLYSTPSLRKSDSIQIMGSSKKKSIFPKLYFSCYGTEQSSKTTKMFGPKDHS